MNFTVAAVYENGIFRPVTPVSELADGTPVVLTIRDPKNAEAKEERRSLSPKEMHEYIRSKNPNAEEIPEELWEKLQRAHQVAISNVRDPEVMRQAAERMDRLREQIYRREGLLDIA